jgi:phosphomannomutase
MNQATRSSAHRFHPTILREYDIRGIVGETLNGADASALGRAYGTLIRRNGGRRVALGFDGRLSSPELAAALGAGIRASGVDVLNIGLGPTPMLYFAVHQLAVDGGVQVTGSHNPPSHNGFKMMLGKDSLYGERIQELGRIAREADHETGEGLHEDVDVREVYVERLLRDFHGGRPLHAVWDAGNGATGDVLTRLVAGLPGRHEVLFAEIDGRFPNHHPDPTVPENLEALMERVRTSGAEVGIAFDGDGDRVGMVDGEGRILFGDQLIQILAGEVLARHPGAPIIADVKASQALFDAISDLGGRPVMYRTGHSLIKAAMKEMQSPLAGEMSGHIFYADGFYGHDDALYVAIRLLGILAASRTTLPELVDRMPALVNTPELRFDCPDETKFDVVERVRARLMETGAEINAIDGVRVTTPDGWWLLRASNTQAVLVARAEAADRAALQRLKDEIRHSLTVAGVIVPEF